MKKYSASSITIPVPLALRAALLREARSRGVSMALIARLILHNGLANKSNGGSGLLKKSLTFEKTA